MKDVKHRPIFVSLSSTFSSSAQTQLNFAFRIRLFVSVVTFTNNQLLKSYCLRQYCNIYGNTTIFTAIQYNISYGVYYYLVKLVAI